MKKILTIILAVMLVMSFSASAFAIHAEIPSDSQAVIGKGTTQITLGGLFRVRHRFFDNLDSSRIPDGTHKASSWVDQRVRLNLAAQVTPNVLGYFQLEGNNTWGSAGSGGGVGNYAGAALSWIEAYIQISGSGLFGFPAGVKIGHMPLALGQRYFFSHMNEGDDALVLFMDPTKQLHLSAIWVKVAEGAATKTAAVTTWTSRVCADNVVAGVFVTTAGAPCPAGTTQISGTSTTTPAVTGGTSDNTDDKDAYVLVANFKPNDKNMVGVYYVYLNWPDMKAKFQNLGFTANGSVGGFGYKGEVDIQFGKDINQKFRGYGIYLAGNYQVNPVNIRASFGLGSGDSNGLSDGKNSEFQVSIDDDRRYTFAYDWNVRTAAMNNYFGSTRNTGIANTTVYNIGIDMQPAKAVKVGLDGYILRATKVPSNVSKKIGWEIDAYLGYTIAKNLTYGLDVAWFKPGQFYDQYTSDRKAIPYVRQQLVLSF